MTIDAPGIYAIGEAEYHADPCPEPSLSASLAHVLCTSTPAHARYKHPRLNRFAEHEEAEHFDIGTCAHAMLLEGRDCVEVLDFPDWRTKASREAREAARAAGKTPLLRKIYDDVNAMVQAARIQLDAHQDGHRMFRDGQAEPTLVWRERSGIWCRARLDWMRDGAVDDFKTTAASANPEKVSRSCFDNGWDLKVAFYRRGMKLLTGRDVEFRFAVQECYPPYALSVVDLAPSALMLGEKKLEWALELWTQCLRTDRWPTYGHRTASVTVPPWIEEAWLAKEVAYAV